MKEELNLEPGQMLSCYRLVESIGAGGMGVVWEAVDTRLDRVVALKVLSPEMAAVPDRLKRFEREAKTVASLNHPNIVTLFSVEQANDLHFITMELIRGTTLQDQIPLGGFTLGRFFELALPLCEALGAAHDRGIIHRDLKPANIMINEEGRLKVLDFGLAKLREQPEDIDLSELPTRSRTTLTQEGHIAGTIAYMSPEQLQGRPIDPRSDLFSLGIILYEMATGSRPFRGSSSADVVSAIMRDVPPSVTDVKKAFPNHLGRIIRHCLEKDPERRCESAKGLRNELEDLMQEVASAELPRKISTPLHRPSRPWIFALAAVGSVLLVILGLTFFRAPSDEPRPGVLAILPFENMTGDESKGYLSEGISAGLITELSEVSGIRLIGRSEAWSEARRNASPSHLAKRFGVSAVLEGEVQQVKERLRVDVKLTDAASGMVLWSETFGAVENELFDLQDEIARRLTSVLSIRLSTRELKRLARDPTGSLQAYDLFLRGHQRLQTDNETAIEMFRQAIRLDPRFALAHAWLSRALWASYQHDKAGEKLVEAESEARLALEIDPELPAAQVALARVYRDTSRYAESIDELQDLLAKHPKPAEAQRELAYSYERVGDLEQAEKCLRTAAALDEKDWFNWNALGDLLDSMGRYDEALEAFRKSGELAPAEMDVPHINSAAILIQLARFEEAIEAYERTPGPIREMTVASNIGTAYYFSDRPDKWEKAEEYYRLATRLNPRHPVARRNLADLYQEVGRHEDARHHYREALRLVEEQLEHDPENLALMLNKALYAAKSGECGMAVPLAAELADRLPGTARDVHWLAWIYALWDREDEALEAIRSVIALGVSKEIIRQEPEFRSLREDAEFVELTATD
jgi:serine/threonine protein kinase/tetratricopeptide (TPR) repeat protein